MALVAKLAVEAVVAIEYIDAVLRLGDFEHCGVDGEAAERRQLESHFIGGLLQLREPVAMRDDEVVDFLGNGDRGGAVPGFGRNRRPGVAPLR